MHSANAKHITEAAIGNDHYTVHLNRSGASLSTPDGKVEAHVICVNDLKTKSWMNLYLDQETQKLVGLGLHQDRPGRASLLSLQTFASEEGSQARETVQNCNNPQRSRLVKYNRDGSQTYATKSDVDPENFYPLPDPTATMQLALTLLQHSDDANLNDAQRADKNEMLSMLHINLPPSASPEAARSPAPTA